MSADEKRFEVGRRAFLGPISGALAFAALTAPEKAEAAYDPTVFAQTIASMAAAQGSSLSGVPAVALLGYYQPGDTFGRTCALYLFRALGSVHWNKRFRMVQVG